MMVDKLCGIEGSSSSRGLLASIENIDISRLKPKHQDNAVVYPWHAPSESLAERKTRAEGRRAQLLELLYDDGISTGQVEELVREWIALVTERDQILREELQKENKVEKVGYIQDLKWFLHHMPSLDQSGDEVTLRDALLSLERHVTTYCHSHDISSPPPNAPPFRSLPAGPFRGRIRSSSASDSTTPTQTLEDNPEVVSLPGNVVYSQFPRPRHSVSPLGNNPSLSTMHHPVQPDTLTNGIPPPPPPPSCHIPPPPPPPPPPVPRIPLGVRGTGQFVGTRRQACQAIDEVDVGVQPNTPMRKDLMEEITSVGRGNLRPTQRARSPGGTPINKSRKMTVSSNNDLLQRALLKKFRSMHSTPMRQNSPSEPSSFDVSNAWSDINNSLDFADPDITTCSSNVTSGFLHCSDVNASRRSTAV